MTILGELFVAFLVITIDTFYGANNATNRKETICYDETDQSI